MVKYFLRYLVHRHTHTDGQTQSNKPRHATQTPPCEAWAGFNKPTLLYDTPPIDCNWKISKCQKKKTTTTKNKVNFFKQKCLSRWNCSICNYVARYGVWLKLRTALERCKSIQFIFGAFPLTQRRDAKISTKQLNRPRVKR